MKLELKKKGKVKMGKISSQVSKGLGAAIQEAKNKISDDASPEKLLNSGVEVQKKRHRRTKAEIQAEKEAKAAESQDNSLFEALDIHEESQEEEVEDNRPDWEKRSAKNLDEFCEWELEKAKLKGLENPDFDFRNFYEKGQTIYYIHILRGGINTKELKKLKIRTIYPRMMVCNEEKSCCQCIHYESRDLIFEKLKDADAVYQTINMVSEEELEKAKSGRKSSKGTVEYPEEENGDNETYMSLEEVENGEED